jgi:hypothetical protein
MASSGVGRFLAAMPRRSAQPHNAKYLSGWPDAEPGAGSSVEVVAIHAIGGMVGIGKAAFAVETHGMTHGSEALITTRMGPVAVGLGV